MNLRTLILTGLLLPGLLVALPPCALASATWYVDGLNNDANNCLTAQTACKTIGHAISLASSGDSIIVAPVTYVSGSFTNQFVNLQGQVVFAAGGTFTGIRLKPILTPMSTFQQKRRVND
jgi:hypothetical protein